MALIDIPLCEQEVRWVWAETINLRKGGGWIMNSLRKLMEVNNKEWEKAFDSIHDWVCIIDLDSKILRSNKIGQEYFSLPINKITGQKCCKLIHGTDKPLNACPLLQMLKTRERESAEIQILDGRWMMITVDPIFDDEGYIIKAVHIARDITRRTMIQNEKEQLILELQKALAKVTLLSGLVPICASCKKIRDDKGYWTQIESFIQKYASVDFSHSICPDCAKKLYPDLDIYDD
ncbi:MAG: PAS domain-containing protein [Pseudomonadota bacterium]